MKKVLTFIMLTGLVLTIQAKVIYVATDGNDMATGKINTPLATMGAAWSKAISGDTIYFRGGTYRITDADIMRQEKTYAWVFYLNKAGTARRRTCIMGYPGERPVFDFSALQLDGKHRFGAFYLGADYLHLRNFDIVGVPVRITGHTQSECISARKGSHCIIENLAMHDGMAIGYYQTAGADNLVLNCDAYNNYDDYSEGVYGGNVDGFGCHVTHTTDTGNVFRNCRAWRNSDDGFDLINCAAPCEIDHCWAFYNGFRSTDDAYNTTTFQSAGDGNGFKAGGWGMSASETKCPNVCPQHYVHHCTAYKNKSQGFYSNHHLGGNRWEYNTASDNRANYNMVNRRSTESTDNVDVPGYGHNLRNNVSWNYTDKSKGGHLTNCDTQSCILKNNSFYPPASTITVTASMFVSTNPKDLFLNREADGTLPQMIFMRAKGDSKLAELNMGWSWEDNEDTDAVNELLAHKSSSKVNNYKNTIYDLQGRRVSNIRRGHIYIKNGKRFLAE